MLRDRLLEDGTIAINGERIAAVFESGEGLEGSQTLDYRGSFIVPGLVDTHIHSRSSAAEGMTRATSAAAAGGVTTVVDMPYDTPEPTIHVGRLLEKTEEIASQAVVDVGLYGTMPKVNGLTALDPLLEAGVCAFKFSLFETDPKRFPRIADPDLLDAFTHLSDSQIPIVIHAENQEIIERLLERGRAAGETDPGAHARSRPVVSEISALVKTLELAFWSKARIHIAHVTHPRGFELIDIYRSQGAHVSGETCVTYLTLTNEDDVARMGTLAKINPPVRDAAARDGLWQHLLAGRIAAISTDHAPWPADRKSQPILEAAAGVPGLETFLPALWTEASRRNANIPHVLSYATWRPAELFGLGQRKGSLEPGKDADFVVFNTSRPWKFDPQYSHSSAHWSPFAGHEFAGRVETVFLRGRKVAAEGEVLVEPGYGVWLRRNA